MALILPDLNAEKPKKPTMADVVHPTYANEERFWRKWRLTYKAGEDFVEQYLEQFSIREAVDDFNRRKRITPIPAFAKAAINDIKNAIFQRMSDTTRKGGPDSYQKAILGESGGVNRSGGSMNWFIGDQVLPELLTMKRVGVYVDSPVSDGTQSQKDRLTVHPYLYTYNVEDIRSWGWKADGSRLQLRALLLRDHEEILDESGFLPVGVTHSFRKLWIAPDGFVRVQFFTKDGEKKGTEIKLNIRRIPFVMMGLSDSLLSDAASYQIALLNLESADVGFCLKSNFPFYTEQSNGNENAFAKRPVQPVSSNLAILPSDPTTLVPAAQPCYNAEGFSNGSEITVGNTQGRRYPLNTDRPEFIAPPTEPLQASMEKQEKLKEDIRLLINLALSNVKPQMASAESKAMDQAGLESGLSYIGLELEHGERQIAEIWAEYEGKTAPTVKYPERYGLKTDEEQRTEAKEIKDQIFTVPSRTYQKETVKRIATVLLGNKVSAEKLATIHNEVDASNVITADPETLTLHLEDGLVSNKTASVASGYSENESEQAAKDHADRLARIAQAQSDNASARGLPDLGTNSKASAQEKQGKPQRGEGQ